MFSSLEKATPQPLPQNRRSFLRTAATTIAATRLGLIGSAIGQPAEAMRLSDEGDFPSLGGATGWLNSQPLTPGDVRGKVVLVEFWTYTCVNWRRTLPYVRAWAEKYKERGLVVIGVHTPEFSFEKNIDNIRWALKDMRIDYPVAVDSNHEIWRAFNNEYWPALYFIDAKGHIRHHQFGEGDYAESEAILRQLLIAAGSSDLGPELTSVNVGGLEVAADWRNLRSPENYLGYELTENFSSPSGLNNNKPHTYAAPAQLRSNDWALSGGWTAGKESVALNQADGQIEYRFHARDLNLVMGSAARGASVRFRVLLDGQPPGTAHGVDTDAQGNGLVVEQRLYQLIRQPGPITDRQFQINFLAPGAQAFDFTFG